MKRIEVHHLKTGQKWSSVWGDGEYAQEVFSSIIDGATHLWLEIEGGVEVAIHQELLKHCAIYLVPQPENQ